MCVKLHDHGYIHLPLFHEWYTLLEHSLDGYRMGLLTLGIGGLLFCSWGAPGAWNERGHGTDVAFMVCFVAVTAWKYGWVIVPSNVCNVEGMVDQVPAR